MSVRLSVLLPPPLAARGTSYTCGQIVRGMAGADFSITVVTPRARPYSIEPAETIQVLPRWARSFPYPWLRPFARNAVEAAFLDHATAPAPEQRAAYIWADASLGTLRHLRQGDVPSFREMINGPRGAAKGILDAAYRDLGAKPSHGISDASVTEEDEALALVDYVFCPNAMVTAAVQRRGVSSDKIVEASYGWDPVRFKGTRKALAPINGLTAVFVGTLSVRKGVHLLLRYWSRSHIRGRLVLAGAMEPIIREMCASELARDDVVVLDYVDDVGALFRSADVFVFPTLEEGGPQVTYEACGCRLPVITTPMGAGRIARHGCEGFVLDAYDEAGWIEALEMMAGDPDGREAMARSAAAHAEAFQWHKVALRRREQIEALLNPGDLSGGIDPPGIWREADAA